MHQAAPTRERRLIASIARWFAARCTPADGVRRSRGGVERAVAGSRRRAPAGRAAAVLLAFAVAFMLLLGGREVGEAQTPSLLVSNVGQTQFAWNNFSTHDIAQEFTTGANADGYTLSSIELRINTGAATTATPTVKIFSTSATGTLVATLSGPSSLDASSTKRYTFTASGVTLSASTTYWVVAEGTDAAAWTNTNSDSEDADSASDWSIANAGQTRAHDSTQAFSTLSNGRSFQMVVNGSPVDNTAPTFESATADGTSVVITFSEELASTSTPNSAFTVERTRGGVEATATLSNTAPVISGKTVTLTLASSAAILGTDTDVKVSYAKPSSNGLKDSADNEVASFTDQPVTALASVLVSNLMQTDNAEINLSTVSAAQSFRTGTNTGGYTLTSIDVRIATSAGTNVPAMVVKSGSAGGATVATLTGPSAFAANTTRVYRYAAPSGVNLAASTDYWVVIASGQSGLKWQATNSDSESSAATGWSIGNDHQERVTNWSTFSNTALMEVRGEPVTVTDTTAPTFHSATVNGSSLVITFDEDLAAAASLSNSSFSVSLTRDGNPATAGLSLTAPVISGNKVTITLATGAIVARDANVRVSYSKPSTDSNNRLEDAAGNEVASFSNQAVANLTGATTLVSNIGKSTNGTNANLSTNDRAQRFTTGSSSGGYSLASVELPLKTNAAPTTPTVEVRSGSAVGAVVATLKGPVALEASTTRTYTFTGNASLSASTNYWVVARNGTGVDLLWTNDTGEDSTSASGFNLQNVGQARTAGTGNYQNVTVPYKMRVNGRGGTDTTAPTFESATVDGTSVVITFSENLASTSTPNSAFTVERTRSGVEAVATLSNTAPVISGKTVTLTIASSAAILGTDTNVKISYAKPSNNGLKDSSNNEVASFTDQPVTNQTGVANSRATGAPAITTPDAFQVPAVLSVDLSGIADTNGVTNIASSATYQWQRFAANGATLEVANLGTGSTYTLADADVGKRIKVQVRFTDDGSFSEGPLTSVATPVITAAAPPEPVNPHYVLESELMRIGNIRNCSSVEREAVFNFYDQGNTPAENTRVNNAVSRKRIGGGLRVGRINDPGAHAQITGAIGDYCWLREFNWIDQSRARSPAEPPSMPSRSRVQFSEVPQQHTAGSVLSDEYGYNQQGYFRRIVHSDGRVTCHFNGYDGSLANIPCE